MFGKILRKKFFSLDFFSVGNYNYPMINLLAIGKYFLVVDSKYKSKNHFPAAAPRIQPINKINALIFAVCVNIGEPAAVSWISMNIKDIEGHQPWSTAAGSLFFWSLFICYWSLWGRFEAIILIRGVVARLFTSFLIANCQLSIVNC